mgnify:CR=1 FL=1
MRLTKTSEDVSNRINNSVFNMFDKLGDLIYSACNVNHILEQAKLKKERDENRYTIENYNTGEILFDGTAQEAKRWMKEKMREIEQDWSDYINLDKETDKEGKSMKRLKKMAGNSQLNNFIQSLENAQTNGFVLREELKSGSSEDSQALINSLKEFDDKISTYINFFKKYV